MPMRPFMKSFYFGVLILITAGSGLAQTAPGVITGSVKSPTNAPVTGATVRVSNLETGSRAETTTDDAGVFRLSTAAGYYELQAEQGDNKVVKSPITVQASETVSVDLPLQAAVLQDTPSTPQTPLREEVFVTARRFEEEAQEVPIPLSVVNGNLVENAGAFNVNRLKELLPTVQFFSSNPRNSAINIRGLGAPFGLTNDGIEPEIGLYIDGVFYARPASATSDFLDVEQVEVLRGPQGTLFGKNTSAGAINITTRRPSFTP